jgi:hypothetical protein
MPKEMGVTAQATPMPIEARGRFHSSRPILGAWLRSRTATEADRLGHLKLASKAVWLGNVEAPDEASAIEKGAAEFKVGANRLMGDTAIMRGGPAHHQPLFQAVIGPVGRT